MNANINKRTNEVEYSIQTGVDTVRVFTDPHNSKLNIIHAYVPIRNFPSGQVSDDINPRSHEKLPNRLANTIEDSLKNNPQFFHLLNRGVLVLADKARYDNLTETLSFTVSDAHQNGMADGATTDRVLARIKTEIPEFDKLKLENIPEYLQDANVHVEIISGDIGGMLVDLASARNTSVQVKEFALENLGGGFDWLKSSLQGTEFENRIRFRENDSQPVDVRQILGLLTLFHPKWSQEKREPIIAYSNKGDVLDHFRDKEWKDGYRSLEKVTVDILRMYDYINVNFQKRYEEYKVQIGSKARLGMRKEVRFKDTGFYVLPLSQQKTQYLIPDGWLYPILGSFRMLLKYNSPPGFAEWLLDPFRFFDGIGSNLIADVVEESEAMNHNAASVGKSRPLWNSLRKSVEMRRLNIQSGDVIEKLVEEIPIEADIKPDAPKKAKKGKK
jgi:hypothetical protein